MTEFFGPTQIEAYGINTTKRPTRPAAPDPKPEPPATRVIDSFAGVYDGGLGGFIDESNTNRQTAENATLQADYDIAMSAAYEGGMQGLVQDSYVHRLNSEAQEQAQAYDQATAIAMEGGMGSFINGSLVSRSQVEADRLIEDNTYEPGYEVLHENTSTIKQLAADLYYGGHIDDSMPADYLLAALENRLSEDEFSQLNEEIELIGWYDSQSLNLFEDEGQPVSIDGDVGELDELEALAQGIYDDSYTTQPSNGGVFFDPMSPNPAIEVLLPNTIAMEIEQIAEDDPGRALLVKMLIDEKLTPTQRAEVDRILGGGATTSENVAAAVRDPWQGIQGAGKTFINTPGELLELTWDVNNLMQPGASADFSHDTFGFMTMDMDSRAEMGGGVVYDFVTLFGGPGALSRSGLSIVQEGSEFVIKHGGRRIAGISSEAVDTLMPTLRNNPGAQVDTPTRHTDQQWWGSDGDPAPLRMNDQEYGGTSATGQSPPAADAGLDNFEYPHQMPALNAGPETTYRLNAADPETLNDTRQAIRDMPYGAARNAAAETYIRELYGTDQSELRFVLPGNGSVGVKTARKVDVPVIQENGDALLIEVKHYGSGKVRLTDSLRRQIDADALFLRDASPQNQPMWVFTQNPPNDRLIEYLDYRGIPWILYN